jgi:RNA-binding protein
MLKGKQKRLLRSIAQTTKPVMQIGKNGITDNFIDTFNIQLEAHELIKVSVLQNSMESKEELAEALCEATHCELVQIIGNQLVFYRESRKKDKEARIKLPV